MGNKREAVKPFQSVMSIEITIDIAEGQQKKFNLEVKPLGGEKLVKYNKDLEASLAKDNKTKEEQKAVKKARKTYERLYARFSDIEETIGLLRQSGKDGNSAEKLLSAIVKKEELEPKLWDAEDALEALTENDEGLSTGEIIVRSDKEMKKLFDLIVIDDDGLAAFMENEEIGYTAMAKYIQDKMSEERGND